MKITRRESLVMGACAAALSTVPAIAAGRDSLDGLARAKRLQFGSVIGGGRPGTLTGSMADPRYCDLVVRECGLIVPENELKWQALRPTPDKFDFARADRIVAWAKTNRLGIRGHTLLWHHPDWMPRWVAGYDFGANPASKAAAMIQEHVATVCKRYRGTIHSYDVVNEAVDNRSGVLRETAFSKAMGAENVIDLAFRTAKAEAPDAQLVYNDYMSWEPWNPAHRAGVLRLLEALKKRGTPVDALGVQAHIGSGNDPGSNGQFGPRDEPAWRRFLDEVTGMGYDLLITEFDVHDKTLPAGIIARDRAVADYARAYLDIMLSYQKMRTMMVWGMSDRYSWLQNRTPRADQLPKRPCPYDSDFQPKPLRTAIADALRASPFREA